MNVALMIPDRVRSERLMILSDPIGNAQPFRSNPHMQILYAIWYEFIEPSKNNPSNLDCSICLQNVLTNFRQMKTELLRKEREYKLLQTIEPAANK